MGIDAAVWAAIARLVEGAPGARGAAARVRAELPQLRVSVVDADDLRDEAPALRAGTIDVHLMATDGHCWRLTTDPAQAAAIVLADRAKAHA